MSMRRSRRRPSVRALRPVIAEMLEHRTFLSADAGPYIVIPSTDRAAADANALASDISFTQYQIYVPDDISPAISPGGRSPAQIRKSYGVDSIQFNSIVGDGTGQTIAIIDAYDNPSFVSSTDPNFNISDLHRFDQQFGLPDPPSFTKLNQTGGTTYPSRNSGWTTEIALDVEWAHSIAPGANIVLVEANSAYNTDLNVAISYAKTLPNVVAISMSFGGSEFSSDPSSNSRYTTPSGHTGITYLASTGDDGAPGGTPSFLPNVVAVGGTKLNQSDSSGTYGSETGWIDGGGGISKYESKPTYQTYVTTQSNSKRTIPDVSMDADPASGVAVLDTSAGGIGSSANWLIVGGTSLSAPMWAGLIAITDEGRALLGLTSLNGITQTLPRLYTLAASDFHDVISGNNGFSAAAGYDLVTGRGTPKADLLVPDLAGGVTLNGTVFFDASADGTLDMGETGISGITVYLDLNNNGTKDSTEPSAVTDSSGNYSFNDLPGNAAYQIRVVIPSSYTNSSPSALSTAASYGATLVDNFGFVPAAVVAHAGASYTVAEGGSITLSASASTGPITLYEWDTNYDGMTFNPILTGASPVFSATGLDGPSTRTIALRVTGLGTNNVDLTTATLNITNAAPTATFSNTGNIDEGSLATLTFINPTDPSNADVTAGFAYSYDTDGDGTFDIVDSPLTSVDVLFADNGTYTLHGRIKDQDGAYTDYTQTLTVNNVAPTATFSITPPTTETGVATASITSLFDPSSVDATAGFTFSIDIDNDGTFDFSSPVASSPLPIPFSYADSGTYTVRLRLTDKDGDYTETTQTLVVADTAPTATLASSGAVTEGSAGSVSFSNPSDISSVDTDAGFTYSYDFNNDGTFEITNSSSPTAVVPASFLADGPFTRTIRARISDKDGGHTDYTTTIAVTNVAPSLITSVADDTNVVLDTTYSITLAASDPGQDTVSSWTVDWGDGVTSHLSAATAAFNHDYASTGEFTVLITATDEDGSYSFTRTASVTSTPPTVDFVAGDLNSDHSAFQFTLTYDDDLGINLATLGDSDVTVVGPNGPVQSVHLLSTTPSSDNRGYIAVYEATGPVGNWDWEDNGNYSVSVATHEVIDLQGDSLAEGPIGGFTVYIPPPVAPDLVAEFPANVKSLKPLGQKNKITVKLYNHGPTNLALSNVTTVLYLSSDPVWDSSDIKLGSTTEKFSLIVNSFEPATFSFKTPVVTTSGRYYLLARTDTQSAVFERNERNNITPSVGIPLSGHGPDIAAAFTTPFDSNYFTGENFSVGLKFSNVGSVKASGIAGIRFVLSADSTYDDSDLNLLATTASLKSKGDNIFNFSVPIPGSASADHAWHLLAIISAPGDHNGANDTAVSDSFIVN